MPNRLWPMACVITIWEITISFFLINTDFFQQQPIIWDMIESWNEFPRAYVDECC